MIHNIIHNKGNYVILAMWKDTMSCDCKKGDMAEKQLLEKACLKDCMEVPVPYADTPRHWKEFVCGGGAAFCNILISYPLNKLIFRQVNYY